MGVKAFSPDEIQTAYDESREMRSGDYNRYSLKVGKITPERNVFRVMPRHETQEKLFVRVRTHFGLGPQIAVPYDRLPKDAKRTAAPCPEMFGHPCPLCGLGQESFNRARATRDPGERAKWEEYGKALKPKERFGILVVDDLNPQQGVLEFWFNLDLYQKILACFRDDRGRPRDLTDPVAGRNILIEASKKKGTEYDQYDTVKAFDEPSPLLDPERWLAQIYNMEDIHVFEPTSPQLIEALKTGQKIPRAGEVTAVGTGAGGGASIAALLAGTPYVGATSGAETAKLIGTGSTTPPVGTPGTPPPASTGGSAKVERKAPGSKRKAPGEKSSGAATSADPWALGRAWLISQGAGQGFTAFTPLQEMTHEQFAVVKGSPEMDDVPCFTTADPAGEAICRTCKVLLPCATAKVSAGNAA